VHTQLPLVSVRKSLFGRTLPNFCDLTVLFIVGTIAINFFGALTKNVCDESETSANNVSHLFRMKRFFQFVDLGFSAKKLLKIARFFYDQMVNTLEEADSF
jgi:hypothetical protein